jgi:hypothetical protein
LAYRYRWSTASGAIGRPAVVGVVVDEHGQPVAVGSKVRVPSTRIQRAVDVRDGRVCTYPAATTADHPGSASDGSARTIGPACF